VFEPDALVPFAGNRTAERDSLRFQGGAGKQQEGVVLGGMEPPNAEDWEGAGGTAAGERAPEGNVNAQGLHENPARIDLRIMFSDVSAVEIRNGNAEAAFGELGVEIIGAYQ
jgi:hypothetical protein